MKNIVFALTLVFFVLSNKTTQAHCEIPCGIYDDSVRITLIYEHISTIEKSMKMIEKLEAEESLNYNQLVRWVTNKEEHATKIQDIVSQYFMHQRLQPVDETEKEKYAKYMEQLTSLHEILVFAMKAKQTTDEVYINKLRETVHNFELAYFTGHKH
ncbi:MAG: superoxide dismutase [Ni] [Salinivirgaceae bacterium]|jgi:nickel superoxide dismutase|nr:superoxide dismutase [Ni] [Salinivirgaceae bacterium]